MAPSGIEDATDGSRVYSSDAVAKYNALLAAYRAGVAANKGLREALGEVLKHLEADDYCASYIPIEARTAYERARAALAGQEEPVMCEDCGEYPADPPSKLCPGCEAYSVEHQA